MSVDQEMLTLAQSAGFAFAVVVNHEIVERKRAPEVTRGKLMIFCVASSCLVAERLY